LHYLFDLRFDSKLVNGQLRQIKANK